VSEKMDPTFYTKLSPKRATSSIIIRDAVQVELSSNAKVAFVFFCCHLLLSRDYVTHHPPTGAPYRWKAVMTCDLVVVVVDQQLIHKVGTLRTFRDI
jgi:hypothetical protein